ncbi:MAG: TetR/AcrR family transcriptional regulator [Firmicutes bacterium]|nr:TetR/AcrR family transcriptional regulator [Bacillota bacterium]
MIPISLREDRKKELKEEIYLQAVRLFKEKGYENVTIEDITSACRIAKGTFYNYFPRKESILLHLGLSQMEVLKEGIARNSEVNGLKESLKLIFKDLMLRNEQDPSLFKAHHRNYSFAPIRRRTAIN